MQYEFRTYHALPGQLPALLKHLETKYSLLQQRAIAFVGAWTDDIGTNNQVTCLLSFENEAARAGALTALSEDLSWREYLSSEQRTCGPVVDHVTNTLLRLTPYSPAPKVTQPVQELRIYDAMPGRLDQVHERFSRHTIRLFGKHGIEVTGFWTEEFGTGNRLVYMTAFPDLASREKRWGAFGTDPEWLQVRAETERNGAIVARIHNRMLRQAPLGSLAKR
jgi:hypothetical protein